MEKEFKIITKLSSDEINKRILKLLNKKFGIPFISKNYLYKGTINENSFTITTQFDNPPIVLNAEFNNGEIDVKVKWESLQNAFKGLVFGLIFPAIFMIVFLIIYNNPKEISSYLLAILIMIMYYIFQKIIIFIYYQEPNHKTIIKDLKKVLK